MRQHATLRRQGRLSLLVAIAALGLYGLPLSQLKGATVDRYWEFSPYKVQILLAPETSSIPRDQLAKHFSEYFHARTTVAYGPLWKLDTQLASPATGVALCSDPTDVGEQELAAIRQSRDKLIVVVVRETPRGFQVSSAEYDGLLEQWGPVRSYESQSLSNLNEVCFHAITEVFSPLALFRVIRDATDKVELRFRGALLPRSEEAEELVPQGAVLRPYLREVDREGVPVADGINPVTWTYLAVSQQQDDHVEADVFSHTRNPFSSRQRGRVEQLAIVTRDSGAVTKLHLHARENPEIPLAGFEVYQQDSHAKEPTLLGNTNRDGEIIISPGESPVQFALVRSAGQWIARIPVVPGVDSLVEAPLVDDRKRLEAAARLAAIQEELVDVIARRKLIEARIKAHIRNKNLPEATKLLEELDKLPNLAYFQQQRLAKEALLVQSDEPRVQARIDKMFEATRAVVNEFLAPGLVQELRNEIAAAGKTAQK